MEKTTSKSLKNLYNQAVVEDIAVRVTATYSSFRHNAFVADILRELPALELKDRASCITAALRKYLPDDYEKAVALLRLCW